MRAGIIGSVVLWALIGWGVSASIGCSAVNSAGDHVTLTGTPKGIQAFADLSNGLIRTGKEASEQPSEFFAHRATQEREHTARKGQAVGFWQKLVN